MAAAKISVNKPKSTKKSSTQSKPKSTSKSSTLTLDTLLCGTSKSKSLPRPLSSITLPPSYDPLSTKSLSRTVSQTSSGSQSTSQPRKLSGDAFVIPPTPQKASKKGKEKAFIYVDSDEEPPVEAVESDSVTQMLVDIMEPRDVDDLAVHKKKVDDIRRWLEEAFEGGLKKSLKKYRRILALTGPAGTGKTATLRVLSRELGFDILEWAGGMDEKFGDSEDYDRETLSEKFDSFLGRSATYGSILTPQEPAPVSSQQTTLTFGTASTSQTSSTNYPSRRQTRRIILIEDLPNISHSPTQRSFHDALQSFLDNQAAIGVPLVLIVSDEGRRGITEDGRGTRDAKVDVRSVLPSGILGGLFATEIRFNPTPPTILKKALQSLMSRIQSSSREAPKVDKDLLDKIAENANGDIRSAIMAIEFLRNGSSKEGKKKGRGKKNARTMLEVVTQRENSLHLFHLLGKVLYNKRKGDPPAQSLSAKERRKEAEADAALQDDPKLPPWIQVEERQRSRVDVEVLYSDSPVDTSLYSLYLHNNYTKFCADTEQCDALSDWLSCIDSMGGGSDDSYTWQTQTNPHQFHILTLGVLHSLPTPVPRSGQKLFKPAFFEWNTKKKEAEGSVDEVGAWMDRLRMDGGLGGRWGRREIACETGVALAAKWRAGDYDVPSSFKRFAEIKFAPATGRDGGSEIWPDADGGADADSENAEIEADGLANRRKDTDASEAVQEKGWLDEDDIEELD